MLYILRREAAFIAGALTTLILLTVGHGWLDDLGNVAKFVALFVWVFAVMVACAFAVVRHADALAELLGEPYGTLILTIAVTGIEVVVIGAVVLNGDANPTLARDTIFAALVIMLNGLVGLSLLIGGLRYREQDYNLQGARAFLGMLVTLATISLILPRFTISAPGFTAPQAIFFAVVTIALYATFLAMQTTRYRAYFEQPAPDAPATEAGAYKKHADLQVKSAPYHAVFLILTLVPIVLLSDTLAVLLDFGLAQFRLPLALGGVLVAILVLTPEGLTALHAASANQLQRSVNVCLGASLATISLTVPTIVLLSLVMGLPIELGLGNAEMVLLVLTLALSMITFSAARTSILQGAVHLVVFLVFFFLIFDP